MHVGYYIIVSFISLFAILPLTDIPINVINITLRMIISIIFITIVL